MDPPYSFAARIGPNSSPKITNMLRSFLVLTTFVITLPAYAQDSCEYANDTECDNPNFVGTGACEADTDAMDCVQAKPLNG